jgi:hypothetical protein
VRRHVTMWDERAHPCSVAAAHGSWGQSDLGDAGKDGSSPDNDGRSMHRQRLRSGKQDGTVYECRNQWLNPLQNGTGSNLVDTGRVGSESASDRSLRRASRLPIVRTEVEVSGNDCGVPGTSCRGRAGHHPRRMGRDVPGNRHEAPSPRQAGKERRPLMAPWRGGALVVVRGWESQPHGEGGQQVRSVGVGMPGGRP